MTGRLGGFSRLALRRFQPFAIVVASLHRWERRQPVTVQPSWPRDLVPSIKSHHGLVRTTLQWNLARSLELINLHSRSDHAEVLPGLVHFAKKINPMNSTTFILFGKYCPIVDQLDSKDSSRDFQLNCVINFFLPTFNTLCKRLKIVVIEREWKNLEFGWHLNKALSNVRRSEKLNIS